MNFKSLLGAAMVATSLATGCTTATTPPPSLLDRAEQACRTGHVQTAQALCDSLTAGTVADSLSVADLCRFSLVLMRLADSNANEQANTALAARYFHSAVSRNSDSTAIILGAMPAEDMARIMILNIIAENSAGREGTDSLGCDSIPHDLFIEHEYEEE